MTEPTARAAAPGRKRVRDARARKQVRALSRDIRRQLSTPQPGAAVDLTPLAAPAHTALTQLRRDVLRRGGSGARAAAAGLRDADRGLAKVVAAHAASTPQEAARLLGEAAAALEAARRKAKEAGDAWPA